MEQRGFKVGPPKASDYIKDTGKRKRKNSRSGSRGRHLCGEQGKCQVAGGQMQEGKEMAL